MIAWLTAILASVLYAPAVEYLAHRWVMHVPGLGRNPWWKEHAIEHHAHRRDDVNIGLSPLTVFVAASPMLLWCVALGWVWLACVVAGSLLYAGLWSALHAAYHGVGCEWIQRWSYYSAWRQHHMLHHEHPSRNFGAVCIWTDYIFGTKHTETNVREYLNHGAE